MFANVLLPFTASWRGGGGIALVCNLGKRKSKMGAEETWRCRRGASCMKENAGDEEACKQLLAIVRVAMFEKMLWLRSLEWRKMLAGVQRSNYDGHEWNWSAEAF